MTMDFLQLDDRNPQLRSPAGGGLIQLKDTEKLAY